MGIKRQNSASHSNKNPPKKFWKNNLCDRKPTAPNPNNRQPQIRRNNINMMSNDWDYDRVADRNTTEPQGSGFQSDWVRDVVNKAVNSVGSTMNITTSRPAAPRKSLLNPAYLSEDTGDDAEPAFKINSTRPTTSSRFASLGTNRKKLLSPASSITLNSHASAAGPSSSSLTSSTENSYQPDVSGYVPFEKPVEQFNSASTSAVQYQKPQANDNSYFHRRAQGYQGTQGYLGAQGYQGAQGYHGVQDYQTQSAQGYQGMQGYQNSQPYPYATGQSWHEQIGCYNNYHYQ